jgi:hypothetical protein
VKKGRFQIVYVTLIKDYNVFISHSNQPLCSAGRVGQSYNDGVTLAVYAHTHTHTWVGSGESN